MPNEKKKRPAELDNPDRNPCQHEWIMPQEPYTVLIDFCRYCGMTKPLFD